MGNCCCKNKRCFKSPSNKTIKKSIEQSAIDDCLNTIEPMLKSDESQSDESNTNEEEEHISEMLLCDDTTNELCPITLKIINILTIYHLFLHHYNKQDLTKNICEIINDNNINDCDVLTLREDYHHIITYHDSNDIFMKEIFDRLIIYDNNNGIHNLLDIDNKIEMDEDTNYYFGHLQEDEILMIQCLNQIHHDCTHKYSNDYNNKSNIDDSNIVNAECIDEMAHGIQRQKQTLIKYKQRTESRIRNDTNIYNRKANDIYCDECANDKKVCIDVDVRYSKDDKGKRKIGKLKIKQSPKKQKQFDKIKVKPQMILNDDSWMSKEYKNKKSKHIVSDSITKLVSTKLVSNNRWGKSLDALQESSSFDLTSFDLDGIRMGSDTDDSEKIIYEDKRRNIDMYYREHLKYDNQYGIDRV